MQNFRVHNFSAGPSALPTPVLEQIQKECLNWDNHGFAAFEFSHRHKDFISIAHQTQQDLKQLLAIDDDYEILFLQGGATTQFASIPMNLLASPDMLATYIVTGSWSQKAYEYAQPFAKIELGCNQPAATSLEVDQWKISPESNYVHFCPNETISGLETFNLPKTQVPLVADMSSNLLSRPFDVSPFGLIYAGAQKNLGVAGVTLVIVKKTLLKQSQQFLPQTLNYIMQAESESMVNTPPTFAIYAMGLVFKWIAASGGLQAMADINQQKADILYKVIDDSKLYKNNIKPANRSRMNVTFHIDSPKLTNSFLEEAEKLNLYGLKGHKIVGGLRASIYNAVSIESVKCLADFMLDFDKKNG